MTTTDRMLLQRWVSSRDAEAFKELSKRYAQMVYATCRRILGDASEAEDLTQDCFVAPMGGGRKPGDYLGPWLHRVATNLARKRIRGEQRRRRREEKQGLHGAAEETPATDLMGVVDEAIAQLGEPQRRAVIAYYLEDRTYEEIADAAGVTRQGAAHVRLDQALINQTRAEVMLLHRPGSTPTAWRSACSLTL